MGHASKLLRLMGVGKTFQICGQLVSIVGELETKAWLVSKVGAVLLGTVPLNLGNLC